MSFIRPKQLLPCPFCGGTRVELMTNFKGEWVVCRSCHSSGPMFTEGTCEQQCAEAELAWNRRVSSCKVEWFERRGYE